MRRAPALSALLAGTALLVSGCGVAGDTATVPATVKAPPQSARLGWDEQYPSTNPALVFTVSSFRVTNEGWSANVSVRNSSDVGWEVGDPRYEADRQFGVMLFPNDDLDELDRRSREGSLPAMRNATSYRPALPYVLRPGATWAGTISAPGALAGGLYVRVSFGPFNCVGDPPDGVTPQFSWITDHAYRLQEVTAEPA